MKTILLTCLFSYFTLATAQIKYNGLGFVSSNSKLTNKNIIPIINVNANAVAINPFGFIGGLSKTNIHYNSKLQWYGETTEGIIQYAKLFKQKGLKIMLKPQIWVANGEYTGFIKMTNDADWIKFEKSYKKFILNFAKIASNIKADVLCIGVELEQFTTTRPKFWEKLIADVKKIYKGKLTYAANWDEYKRITFWSKLNYIGIDAYFPLSDSKTPSVYELLKKWIKYKAEIKQVVNKYKVAVLFTEFGYRSVNYSTKEPWDSSKSKKISNEKAQCNAIEAIHKTFWKEKWFAGGFLWKWFLDHKNVGGKNNNRFTPQNKSAEILIKKLYSQ